MSTKEEWRPIKGYEGFYEVSSHGRVRSLDRVVDRCNWCPQNRQGKILKGTENRDGYIKVRLYKNSTGKVFSVHRLVAQAFLPNLKKLSTINHQDGNKQNNRVDNLEWASYKENNNHAIRTGLKKTKTGAQSQRAKLTQTQVNEIRKEYVPRKRGKNTCTLAKKYGVSQKTIWNIIHNKTYQD